MKWLRIVFRGETAGPMFAMAFGSGVTVALVFAQVVFAGRHRFGFLVWNLFLSWLPLLFAVLAATEFKSGGKINWRFLAFGAAWLLFFPNAPYICTDLVHLPSRFQNHFWVDLMMILLPAFSGFLVGFLSLYVMQAVVAQRFGRLIGWTFVASIAGLSSFGVYIGRFLRFNSWDVIVRPLSVYRGLAAWLGSPMLNRASFKFMLLFASFLFIAYVMLYALTWLSPARRITPARASDRGMLA